MKKPPNKSRGYCQHFMFQFRTFERIAKLVIIILITNSCTCEYYYRKLDKKCPKIQDTLIVHDTLITKEVHKDTIVSLKKDTVYITKDKLKIKVLRLPGDSIFVDGKCAADTVIKTIKVPYEKIKVETQYLSWQVKWGILLIAIAILIGVIMRGVRG